MSKPKKDKKGKKRKADTEPEIDLAEEEEPTVADTKMTEEEYQEQRTLQAALLDIVHTMVNPCLSPCSGIGRI